MTLWCSRKRRVSFCIIVPQFSQVLLHCDTWMSVCSHSWQGTPSMPAKALETASKNSNLPVRLLHLLIWEKLSICQKDCVCISSRREISYLLATAFRIVRGCVNLQDNRACVSALNPFNRSKVFFKQKNMIWNNIASRIWHHLFCFSWILWFQVIHLLNSEIKGGIDFRLVNTWQKPRVLQYLCLHTCREVGSPKFSAVFGEYQDSRQSMCCHVGLMGKAGRSVQVVPGRTVSAREAIFCVGLLSKQSVIFAFLACLVVWL